MYLGIDIGATKTLVAAFSRDGKILEQVKFNTPREYEQFLDALEHNVAKLTQTKFLAVAVAVPGLLDRKNGLAIDLGNLPWHDKSIRDDISNKLGGAPVVIENDARCAGLAESKLLKDQYQRVLYLTISTGIGGALTDGGRIVSELIDTEMGKIPLEFEGEIIHWENFASGSAIVKRYGKLASEIDDPKVWAEIGERIAYGVGVLCSVLQPEVVVFGGGAGMFSDNFKAAVSKYLERELHPIVRKPKALLSAQHKANGSIYGCFELASRYELSYTEN